MSTSWLIERTTAWSLPFSVVEGLAPGDAHAGTLSAPGLRLLGRGAGDDDVPVPALGVADFRRDVPGAQPDAQLVDVIELTGLFQAPDLVDVAGWKGEESHNRRRCRRGQFGWSARHAGEDRLFDIQPRGQLDEPRYPVTAESGLRLDNARATLTPDHLGVRGAEPVPARRKELRGQFLDDLPALMRQRRRMDMPDLDEQRRRC